jgi:transcriptional regulator with XRE-family HTH domain
MGRHVGRRIAEIRKQKGMTQEYIASLYGKTPQWFSNIERGVRPISADNLAKLAVILEVEPGIFFTGNKEDDNEIK